MEIDYSPFLHVLPNGSIWWPLADAIKLGAGYLPVCDADRDLMPVLRAKNNRVRANERTLWSEFSQPRYTDLHPRLVERDGDRYVEAHKFLEWLSEHIGTQAKSNLAFPEDLAGAVRKASEATFPPFKLPPRFESLTLALEESFDEPIGNLRSKLRQRVEQEFLPIPWDKLSADQRRSVALQLDYQHDPATKQEQSYWFDFWERESALKKQVEEWEATAAPTAAELSLKEKRLVELRQELIKMKMQARAARGDYFPKEPDDGSKQPGDSSSQPIRYVAYPKAMHQLTKRLGATPEELAAWLFWGHEEGGIAAYLNVNELDPPPRFRFWPGSESHDYIAPMMACWFVADDIERFAPAERYITGKVLIERWNAQPGLDAEAFIRAKIAESRLMETHPIYGLTQGTCPEIDYFPAMGSGLFALSQVQEVEAEDFAVNEPSKAPAKALQPAKHARNERLPDDIAVRAPVKMTSLTVRRDARKLDTQSMYKRWQKAYRGLSKQSPNRSDSWYSQQIAKLPIAERRSSETIRKHMNP